MGSGDFLPSSVGFQPLRNPGREQLDAASRRTLLRGRSRRKLTLHFLKNPREFDWWSESLLLDDIPRRRDDPPGAIRDAGFIKSCLAVPVLTIGSVRPE